MSSESLAMFRKHLGPELGQLAEEHMKHDLRQSDRDNLRNAASAVGTHATAGSLIGLGLGCFLAFRLRMNRARLYSAFKATERPTAVKFADGREAALPDLTPAMQPSRLGDVATYMLVGSGGLFLGGEVGLLTGSYRARQFVNREPDSRQRIERAFRGFQADALRMQASQLEQGNSTNKWTGGIF